MSIKLSNVEKVSILACIIKKIDYNTGSPRVILKDISDTIEGLMSREKNRRKNKLLMITTKSLIGIYGKNSRLVSTPILDEILKNNNIINDNGDDNDSIENIFNEDEINIEEDKFINATPRITLTKTKNVLQICDNICNFECNIEDLQIIQNSNDKNLSDNLNQSNNKNTSKSIVNNWSSSFSNDFFLNNESDDEILTN
ncbi:hypothetical protein HCN44_000864 [Aphidius gifuensis]|uniref:Uncharacterized protein n=1 Tax=Aphidius gifuensis TaxID=684658 RepID=A0A834XT61_APHGI|nr:hypothetical protein HCN44_000864 [Aphidius gifuensis]